MTGPLLHRLALLAVASVVLLSPRARAVCPFCPSTQGRTLAQEADEASLILVGTFANAKMGETFGEGTTDLIIDTVIKKHEILDREAKKNADGKLVLPLKKYIRDEDAKYKFLVLCDVFKGAVDPYRGIAIRADCDIAGYLEGAAKLKDKKVPERLKFYFKYLDDPEIEMSNDAFKEFALADYADFQAMAKDLPAEKVVKWLKDPNTPASRFGLYGSMLGHCGSKEHAAVLRAMLDDPTRNLMSGTDGIFAAYTLLDPKEGWAYLTGVLKNPDKDFTQRYAALRAVRFFWETRPDIVKKKEIVNGVALLLDQGDIADLPIEDLRKWRCWSMTERVLGLLDLKSHDVPIIRRAVLRFALAARDPENNDKPHPKAKAFVDDMRKKDAQLVAQAEELLKSEATPPALPTPVPTPDATSRKR